VVVNTESPHDEQVSDVEPAPGAAPRDLYAAYHRKEHGREAETQLLRAFDDLRDLVVKE
jgi:hypothetical protein